MIKVSRSWYRPSFKATKYEIIAETDETMHGFGIDDDGNGYIYLKGNNEDVIQITISPTIIFSVGQMIMSHGLKKVTDCKREKDMGGVLT